MTIPLTLETLRAEMLLLATPIDFVALERDGILRKVGDWYEVPDVHKLPEHVSKRISTHRQLRKGLRVKFV